MSTIVFFDLDGTLSEFRHDKAVEALNLFLQKGIGNKKAAAQISSFVDYVFQEMMRSAKSGEKAVILDALENIFVKQVCQNPLDYPSAMLSRELWISLGIRSHLLKRFRISNKTISDAVEVYWRETLKQATLYPFALWCLYFLKSHGCVLALTTASDGRLRYQRGQFLYDPEYSCQRKLERVEALKPIAGIMDKICIADPWGKRSSAFWKYALSSVGATENDQVFMVGDEYRSDIVVPSGMNICTILVDRERRWTNPRDVSLARHIVRSLEEVPKLILMSLRP